VKRPRTRATRLVSAVLVVAGLLVFEGRAHAGPAPPPAVTTRAMSDGASTVAELRARPLRVPDIQRRQACPKPQVHLRLDGVGPAIEAGPVAIALFSEQTALRYRDEPPWKATKVLWLVRENQPRQVIVRGARIDRRGPVRISGNGHNALRTYSLTGNAESTAPPEWRDIPSTVLVPDSGCYTFQVDGPGFQSAFVLPAQPK
jgi:hypothetical protein